MQGKYCASRAQRKGLFLCRGAANTRDVFVNTAQRYDILIAVLEYYCKKYKNFQVSVLAVILVIWSFGQNRFCIVKIRHYNKIFIFYYSEQMTESKNENDHFDLDHFDQVLASLLTLGIAQTSLALLSLNRSLDHFDQVCQALSFHRKLLDYQRKGTDIYFT